MYLSCLIYLNEMKLEWQFTKKRRENTYIIMYISIFKRGKKGGQPFEKRNIQGLHMFSLASILIKICIEIKILVKKHQNLSGGNQLYTPQCKNSTRSSIQPHLLGAFTCWNEESTLATTIRHLILNKGSIIIYYSQHILYSQLSKDCFGLKSVSNKLWVRGSNCNTSCHVYRGMVLLLTRLQLE